MANQDAPFGARPIGQNGGAYNGQVSKYYLPTSVNTILAVGDIVKSGGTGDDDGVPSIDRAAAGDIPRGIIVGFEFLNRDYEDLPNYRPAAIEAYALVADDPDIRFIIQEDSDGGALAKTDIGLNANIVVANANSSTGRSQMELDSSSADTTSTLDVKILELYQTADNEIGDYAKWVCTFNTHELKSVGTAGV